LFNGRYFALVASVENNGRYDKLMIGGSVRI
jgi:hypothetical protein